MLTSSPLNDSNLICLALILKVRNTFVFKTFSSYLVILFNRGIILRTIARPKFGLWNVCKIKSVDSGVYKNRIAKSIACQLPSEKSARIKIAGCFFAKLLPMLSITMYFLQSYNRKVFFNTGSSLLNMGENPNSRVGAFLPGKL